jgi:hypothetical protein
MTTSKELLQTALEHRQPERVPVDFGATPVTGMHVSIVHQLRRRLLGNPDFRVKVIEPYQMLGEIDDELRAALGIDVIGVWPRKSLLGTEATKWKDFTLFDGTPCLVPDNFNVTPAPDGGWYMYPEGDTSVAPSAHMPKTGCFFDAVIRQKPLDEDHMDPADNLEEFGLLGKDDLAHFRKKAQWLDERKDFGAILIAPGTAFGDIALVPAPFLKDPKGIRDLQEWYMATVEHRDYVYEVFEKQSDIALQNIQTLIELFGDRVQAVYLTGTDFGTQRSLFISLDIYRDLYKPFHKKLNEYVHSHSNWKTFIHSCGAISELIPDLIEAGFDILNPVQCSATGMDPVKLKKEFGKDLVFWGGGVNTQHTMPTGSPDEVYREVLNRIEIFNQGGGYVFDSIHNIQAQTPLDNMSAMFKAIRKSSKN